MPVARMFFSLNSEFSAFLASRPTRKQLLQYHPSERAQERLLALLEKNSDGTITKNEPQELDQCYHLEMLMRMVKAKLRSKKTPARARHAHQQGKRAIGAAST